MLDATGVKNSSAGLRKGSLLCDLLWEPSGGSGGPRAGNNAPTWSWVSINGNISYSYAKKLFQGKDSMLSAQVRNVAELKVDRIGSSTITYGRPCILELKGMLGKLANHLKLRKPSQTGPAGYVGRIEGSRDYYEMTMDVPEDKQYDNPFYFEIGSHAHPSSGPSGGRTWYYLMIAPSKRRGEWNRVGIFIFHRPETNSRPPVESERTETVIIV